MRCSLDAWTNSYAAWAAYWSPIFRALTTQCTNPCREIRHQAFASLQRSLVSKPLTAGEHDGWTAIFDEVLFPLILRLLKPEVYSTDPVGMSETRVQAATLLCRIFLHHLVLLSQWEGMLDLWLRILDIMDRLMNSGQGDNLVSTTFLVVYHRIATNNPKGGSCSRELEEYPACDVQQRISSIAKGEPSE